MPSRNVLAMLAFVSMSATAQQPNGDAHRMQATRPELEASLGRLRDLGRSGPGPAWLEAETSYVRSRLHPRRFPAGDPVLPPVEEPMLGADPPPLGGKSPEQPP